MATEPISKPEGAPALAHPAHETKDASVPGIFGFILFLIVAGVCIHFGLAAMLRHLRKKSEPADTWHPSPAPAAVSPRPNLPRLQISAPADLDRFRAREDSKLNGYGWIDRTNGIVRIPITQAMDLLLQKGLPTGSNAVGPSSLELQQQRPRFTSPEIQRNP